jgi:hypothetical protein
MGSRRAWATMSSLWGHVLRGQIAIFSIGFHASAASDLLSKETHTLRCAALLRCSTRLPPSLLRYKFWYPLPVQRTPAVRNVSEIEQLQSYVCNKRFYECMPTAPASHEGRCSFHILPCCSCRYRCSRKRHLLPSHCLLIVYTLCNPSRQSFVLLREHYTHGCATALKSREQDAALQTLSDPTHIRRCQ